ncbi:MAG: DnaA/Hda family protein [Gemmatimonadota bacterium]|nr:DnaA/Hda family protein [Gemmatimonadota bacterium]
MTTAELDPRRTFDSFVVGPGNRLASAAARRAADSPGTSYNPLFIYSSPGLGKSHLLVATAHRAKKVNPDLQVTYLSLEGSIDDIERALNSGLTDGSLGPLSKLDMLLLDDVELLAGRKAAEELFVRILGELNRKSGQIVLGSSQAPSEIRGLDHRLVERFSGGLIVDIATPEFDTRVDIARRKVEDRGGELAQGVAELLGRVSVTSILELSGIINRLMAIQELEGRLVQTEEIPALLENLDLRSGDEFGAFVDELAGDVATTVEVADAPWRRILREALDAGEAEGYNCGRLRHLLDQRTPPPDTRRIVERFTHDVDRLRSIRQELHRLGDPWPEAALGVLRDPERMEEAEALLTSAYELTRPYPGLPPAPGLEDLANLADAGGQAKRLLDEGESGPRQIYFWSAEGKGARMLLASIGADFQAANPERKIAFISVRDFTEDFIRALTAGVAGAWRERWWKVDLLLVHRLQDLSGTERARDELFHLFEAVHRSGGRIALAADRPPSRIAGIDDRVRKRLEKGLVIEAESDDVPQLDTPATEPIFDPVLGANVLDEEALADFPDIGGGLAASAPGRLEDAQVEAPPTDGFLSIDPESFDALDSLLAGGAPSASSASGSFRQGDSSSFVDGADAAGGRASPAEPAGSDDESGAKDPVAKDRFEWSPSKEEVVWCWHRLDDLIVQEWTGRSQGGGAGHGA